MNWFRRHLNWTWVFLLVLVGIINRTLLEVISEEAAILVWIISIVGAFLLTLWLLKQKHRNWTYAFLIFVPFGWVFILRFENWGEVKDIVNGKVITRPREEDD